MPKARVLATKALDPDIERLFCEQFDFQIASDPSIESITQALYAFRPQGLVVRDDLPEDLPQMAPGLIHIARHGSGVDVIPVAACTQAGICISRVPGGNARSVAEWCLAQTLALLHRIHEIVQSAKSMGWSLTRSRYTGQATDLTKKKVLLLGFGAIAQDLSRMLCLGLGAELTVACRRPETIRPESYGLDQQSVGFIHLDHAYHHLGQTDVLIPCLSLNEATRGIVNADWFKALPPHAIIVNASRGEIVDESAMCEALRRGSIAAAAIDVVSKRSLPIDDPLWTVPRLFITPHLAGHTADAHQRNSSACLQAVTEALILDQCPKEAINPEVWARARIRRYA